MRKQDVVNKIAQSTGVPKVDVLVTLEAFFKTVVHTVSQDDTLYIRGFGSFGPKIRKAKVGQNIAAGEKVLIPEAKVPHFKPSKEFVDKVKHPRTVDVDMSPDL